MTTVSHDLNNIRLTTYPSDDPIPANGTTHNVELADLTTRTLFGADATSRIVVGGGDPAIEFVDGTVHTSLVNRPLGDVAEVKPAAASVPLRLRKGSSSNGGSVRTVAAWYDSASALSAMGSPTRKRECLYTVSVK